MFYPTFMDCVGETCFVAPTDVYVSDTYLIPGYHSDDRMGISTSGWEVQASCFL